MSHEPNCNFVIVEHKMSDAELAEAIRVEGRTQLARRLTGTDLKGCVISFTRSSSWNPMTWVPCSQMLPPPGTKVLTYGPEDRLEIDTYTEGLGWGDEFEGFRDSADDPTHWFLIPELPK